jgi:Zn-dependent protease with chaperone function
VTRTTVGLLAASVLLWIVSAIPVALAGRVFCSIVGLDPDAGVVVALAAWTLSAGLIFLPPVELRVAKLLFGAREPTPEEMAKLRPAWERVCSVAKEDLGDYVLRVEERDEVNATAGGARIVAVTTMALSLPEDELSAMLAHELGHHLDEHPVAALLSWWFALPSLVFDAILRLFGSIAFLGFLLRLLFLVPLVLARLASAILSRSAEYAADRHAARLGYGPALIRLFERLVAQGHDEQAAASPGPASIWSTHPPLPERIARLRRLPLPA